MKLTNVLTNCIDIMRDCDKAITNCDNFSYEESLERYKEAMLHQINAWLDYYIELELSYEEHTPYYRVYAESAKSLIISTDSMDYVALIEIFTLLRDGILNNTVDL